MGKLSADRCIVVTAYDVKNTFIHFSDACFDFKSNVQRSKSEPRSRLSSLDSDECADPGSSSCSSPRATSSTGDDASDVLLALPTDNSPQAVISVDWISCPTPMSWPRWKGTGSPPAGVDSNCQQPFALAQLQAPRALVETTTQIPAPCVSVASGTPANSNMQFTFSMRRAASSQWGIDVTPNETQQALRVDAVLKDGAIEAWNRQVIGGPKKDSAVLVGDLIVGVNGKHECQAMLEESNSKPLLKIEVLRQLAS